MSDCLPICEEDLRRLESKFRVRRYTQKAEKRMVAEFAKRLRQVVFIDGIKNFCEYREIMSRPGVSFAPEQLLMFKNMDLISQQTFIIGELENHNV